MGWIFDTKTTAVRYAKLKRFYSDHHLNADKFECNYFAECRRSHPSSIKSQYKGGTSGLSPFYDISYKKRDIRVLVVGKEAGYMHKEQYGTASNFDARSKVLLKRIYDRKDNRNNHIQGTLITLQKIFQVDTDYIYASYALSNALRCAFQNEDRINHRSEVRVTAVMKKNCFKYLVEEIRILEPTLLITQGAWSMYPFVENLANALETTFKRIKRASGISQNREYGLYEFPDFMCITSHHPSRLGQWEKNLAPHSLWPMLDELRKLQYLPVFAKNASGEYERIVKPRIDKLMHYMGTKSDR